MTADFRREPAEAAIHPVLLPFDGPTEVVSADSLQKEHGGSGQGH